MTQTWQSLLSLGVEGPTGLDGHVEQKKVSALSGHCSQRFQLDQRGKT